MLLHEYVQQVHEQLRASAALGDERTQQIAAALASTADSSVRLAILNAVSAAAAEITSALFEAGAQGSPAITVHVDGDELRVHVALAPDTPVEPPRQNEGDATARISLRLSEKLKADIEQAASRESVSVNTWLVRAAGAALSPRSGVWSGSNVGWSGSNVGWSGSDVWWSGGQATRGAHHITGWVTG